jgi:DNA-binding NarL/FixJ family response regulator
MEHPRTAREDEDIQVVVVDDHNFFRQGLRDLLAGQDLEVVGEAASGEAALKLVEATAPDVVVMDLNMPGIGGVEATRRLTAAAPNTRVLVLTIAADGAHVIEALMAGACGYLLKDASVDDIVTGIRAAATGESLISPPIASKLLTRLRADQREAADAVPEPARADLSEREVEVLRLLVEGRSNREIGEALVLSERTVERHVAKAYAKIGAHSRAEATRYALNQHLV